jgi:hypothetical protein
VTQPVGSSPTEGSSVRKRLCKPSTFSLCGWLLRPTRLSFIEKVSTTHQRVKLVNNPPVFGIGREIRESGRFER